jgi:phosphatidylethanolamine-binding protein (PEBP) family uncharacterized protein
VPWHHEGMGSKSTRAHGAQGGSAIALARGPLLAVVALLAAVAVGGCGSSESSPKTVTAKLATAPTLPAPAGRNGYPAKHVPLVSVTLQSPGIANVGAPGGELHLNARYTCAAVDTWPTIEWTKVPAGTAELVLLLFHQSPSAHALVVDWAVAHINPALHRVTTGVLPAGAVVGRNTAGRDGYEVCPAHGQTFSSAVELLALPRSLHLGPGFDASTERQRIVREASVKGVLIFATSRT